RYSGQEDTLVGFPVRDDAQAIGPFENRLPVRIDLSGDPTAAELLQRVGRTVDEALGHRDMALETLIRAFDLDRDLSRPPLVQVQFTYEDAAPEPIEAAGVRFEPQRAECSSFGLDLTLCVSEEHAQFQYNRDLFE